jgi:hypothetical protein
LRFRYTRTHHRFKKSRKEGIAAKEHKERKKEEEDKTHAKTKRRKGKTDKPQMDADKKRLVLDGDLRDLL